MGTGASLDRQAPHRRYRFKIHYSIRYRNHYRKSGTLDSDGPNRELAAYKLRSFFYPPYENFLQNSFILNAEELATIYHFPGNVSVTPTLSKIASKKSEPPSNLPIKK